MVAAVASVMNKPAVWEAPILPRFGGRSFCSYTNDPARGAETCQAAWKAKFARCRIKTHLPIAVVYKAGNAPPAGTLRLHVCTQTVSSKRVPREVLQRNEA